MVKGWHVAAAHPNFALIKYWGKVPGTRNVPAVESISATVDTLQTEMAVQLGGTAADDSLWLDGAPASPARLARVKSFVELFRQRAGSRVGAQIRSRSNFPLAAGLASSASSFAALCVALDAAFDLQLSAAQRADMARQGSGSAARSMLGGLVHLRVCDAASTAVEALCPATAWPLEVVIGVTSRAAKEVGSTEAMERSRLTSPFYAAFVASQAADIAAARAAIAARDFAALAELTQHSCLKLHAVTQTSQPPLLFASPITWAAIAAVRRLAAAGLPVCFTVDAGPQIKVVCLPSATAAVQEALQAIPGVVQLWRVGLGGGARALPPSADEPLPMVRDDPGEI